MVNAQELEAQRHRLGLEAEIDAARNVHQTAGINQPKLGVQQNAGINQHRVVDENKEVEGVVHPQHQPIAPRGRAQHPAHMMYEEDDADLDRAGATGAIVLPTLPPGVKFTITSTMIQLLNLKGMFRGATGDDASALDECCGNLNEVEVVSIVAYWRATNWLNEMPDDSIRTWNELKKAFLE
ncbi:hypothetical protein KY290_031079 [Solanum tuberosum]|uniref:Integrase core domain containing protein n=1 Tax=Solanum tuberosum TaxID=4113 RepID=A0ABQ7U9Q9_SOLTU|nr:hypothetical protein KY290_031079 [Solanum tuberosum]